MKEIRCRLNSWPRNSKKIGKIIEVDPFNPQDLYDTGTLISIMAVVERPNAWVFVPTPFMEFVEPTTLEETLFVQNLLDEMAGKTVLVVNNEYLKYNQCFFIEGEDYWKTQQMSTSEKAIRALCLNLVKQNKECRIIELKKENNSFYIGDSKICTPTIDSAVRYFLQMSKSSVPF